ncbi:class I SAM-dependent methyltransferase [Candidatus Woesearchaeota archaeon]|nr:class I SAM-dependent methyltransferase [Candidatus Woesearchaeota archaeon]
MPNYQQAYREKGKEFSAVHQRQASVEAYSRCRYIPPEVIYEVTVRVFEGAPQTVLEAATGNGRFFVPFAAYAQANHPSTRLVGMDISKPMLEELAQGLVGYENTEIHHASLEDAGFFECLHDVDRVFSFATMHILSEHWQHALDNLVACLSPNGKIILGEEINAVFHGTEAMYEHHDYRLTEVREWFSNEVLPGHLNQVVAFFQRYHNLRSEAGLPFTRFNSQVLHGDQSPAERYLRSKGFTQQTFSGRAFSWLKPHSFAEILYCLEQGTVTTLGTDLPDETRQNLKDELQECCRSAGYNLKTELFIPSQIQLHVFER